MKTSKNKKLTPFAALTKGKIATAATLGVAAGLLIASTPSYSGQQKVTVCHKGEDISVAVPAVAAHLMHGDFIGSCSTEPPPAVRAL